MDFDKMICAHVRRLVPYQSARRIGGHGHVFLNANEAPKADAYLLNSTTLNRYPECQPEEVVAAYAAYAKVSPAGVMVTRGSDEAIGLIIRTFVESPDEGIAVIPPTYGVYEVAAATNNVRVVRAARGENFALSAASLITAVRTAPFKVKAVFIDTPCNPLGTVAGHDFMEQVLRELDDVLIVADEAYTEFAPAGSDMTDLLPKYQNLIVLRTLSKAFALAGIRCGFALAAPEAVRAMLKVIDPYPVSVPVAQIAAQALASGGIALMRARVSATQKRREILEAALKGLRCVQEIFPSCGNYVLARFTDAAHIFSGLAARGIIIRSFTDRPGLENCLRVSVGSDEELDELMRALTALQES